MNVGLAGGPMNLDPAGRAARLDSGEEEPIDVNEESSDCGANVLPIASLFNFQAGTAFFVGDEISSSSLIDGSEGWSSTHSSSSTSGVEGRGSLASSLVNEKSPVRSESVLASAMRPSPVSSLHLRVFLTVAGLSRIAVGRLLLGEFW